ncbi:MAG: HAMP domain-containing histidine kinase [Ruminococcus sp.]|nr:HAMP domain-containing histidine kinase [Ruminococcus sp.]
MNYKESSYHRQFKFAFITIISVLVFISVILVMITSRIYRNSELDSLEKTGGLYIDMFADEYRNSGQISNQTMQKLHYKFSNEEKLKIYIYDKEGKCIFAEGDYDKNLIEADNRFSVSSKTVVPSSEVKDLDTEIKKEINGKKKKYLKFDSRNLLKSEPYLLYGTKKTFVNNTGERDRMYILFCGRTDNINSFTLKIIIVVSVMSLAVIYLFYVLLSRRTKKLTKYEYDFLRVSEMYVKGDFSETLSTDIDGIPKEITQCVNALAENLKNSEEASKTFIANVSHELRTPITTVGGFVSGILDGTIPKSRQNEYLVIVSKEIQRLKILISSMLNMTKFESGTMTPNFRETNLTDLVIQTVLMFEKKIDEKNLDILGLDSQRLVAVADADLMQQVIYNLVENAVKFVNHGGTLTFEFEKVDGMNCVSIKNTGEGLRDNEIQQVFDRFYKTDASRGKDAAGLGLGLAISRKIVHLHKGHIVVKSVYGEYTKFIIQIPDLNINNGNDNERTDYGRKR